MKVTFLYPKEEHLSEVEEIDPDENPEYFNVGKRVWVVQTYIWLKEAGYSVHISSDMPQKGIVFFHRSSLDYVEKNHSWGSDTTLVCIRADRPPVPGADAEIVQNKHCADGERTHFIPHWPQPGLKPRRPGRGAKVKVLSYKGASAHLHDSLKSDRWRRFVRQNNFQWRSDSVEWSGHDHFHSQLPWTDYRDVDVIIALRNDLSHHYPRKPATKLINAWMAGVPAILGPEVAFRELRESEFDYIEANSLEDVMKGVNILKENNRLYNRMVERGKNRFRQFCRRRILESWAEKIDKISKNKNNRKKLSVSVPIYYLNKADSFRQFARRKVVNGLITLRDKL